MAGGGTQSTSQMKTFGGAPAYTPDPTSTMLQPPPAAPQGAPASYGSMFSQAPQRTAQQPMYGQQPSYAQMYSPYAQMNAQYNQMYSPFRGDVQSMYGRGQQMANQYGQGYGLQAISPIGQIGYQNAMANFMQPRGIQSLPMAQYQSPRPNNFYYQPKATTLDHSVATKASAEKAAAEERARQEAEAALYQQSDNGGYYSG